MSGEPYLLRLTIFQHQHVIDVQRIKVAARVRRHDRQADFFGENFDAFLAFDLFVRRGRGRLGRLRSRLSSREQENG